MCCHTMHVWSVALLRILQVVQVPTDLQSVAASLVHGTHMMLCAA